MAATGNRSTRPVLAVALALVVLGPAVAAASRPPTLSEREKITLVFPAFVRNAPVECVWLNIRISSRNASYARAAALVLNWRQPGSRCLRYATDGFNILRKRDGKWRFIYSGSDNPPCALKVPRDLVGCRTQ
jgi:hypothetical protein